MTNFKWHKFDELYSMSSGISSKPSQAGHGSPFLSFSTVFNNYFIPNNLDDLMDTSKNEQEIFSVKKGDIFLTRTSETIDELGMSSVAIEDYPNATFSGFVKRLRPLQNDITYDKYMAFYLRSRFFRKTMNNNAIMTLRASLNEDIFSYLKLYIPDYDTQKQIGDFLFLLECKIKVNNLINKELEALTKTIYDYWFVQFEFPNKNGKPYKASGGKMEWNKELKKEIPVGWEVKQMNELLKKNSIKFDFTDKGGNIDTIDLSKMRGATMCINEKSRSDSFSTNLYKLKKFDILFGGIRPYLLKAGFSPFDGLVTGTVHSFKVINENEYNFSLMTMVQKSMFSFAVSNSKGTKMPVIGADDLLNYKVAYNKGIIEKFNQFVSFKEIIAHNINENHKIEELIEWLLPMLLNGQVKIH